jgi:hypothetical protein
MNNTRWIVLAMCVAAGCANYSQLQDAETLRRGEQKIGAGVSFTKYEVEELGDGDEAASDSVSVPALVLWARRGIIDRLELQATAWLPLGARVGGKYQFLGRPGETGLHVSVGAHLGYLELSASSDDGGAAEDDASVKFIDAYLPLHVGYRISPATTVYAAPQYVLRSASDADSTSIGHVGGATLGAALGRSTKLHLEAGAFYDTLAGAPIINTAVGVSF